MCVCTPNKRTPFCGKPGCEGPPQRARVTEDPAEAGTTASVGALRTQVMLTQIKAENARLRAAIRKALHSGQVGRDAAAMLLEALTR